MRTSRRRREERELLLEAFLGGWQAALGQYVHPRSRAVVEGCFDLWLEEAADEVKILGLAFRGRRELPQANPDLGLRVDLATGEPVGQVGTPAPPTEQVAPVLTPRVTRHRRLRARSA